jgi:hypothetical protein
MVQIAGDDMRNFTLPRIIPTRVLQLLFSSCSCCAACRITVGPCVRGVLLQNLPWLSNQDVGKFFRLGNKTISTFRTKSACLAHPCHDVSAVAYTYAANGKLAMLLVACAELHLACSSFPFAILLLRPSPTIRSADRSTLVDMFEPLQLSAHL